MAAILSRPQWVNTLRPRQNGRRFADDIFKCIFLNENVWIPIKISLKFVPRGPINYIPALVQIMAWRRPGDKPLSEQMMIRLPTHICVTRPQWVKAQWIDLLQWSAKLLQILSLPIEKYGDVGTCNFSSVTYITISDVKFVETGVPTTKITGEWWHCSFLHIEPWGSLN